MSTRTRTSTRARTARLAGIGVLAAASAALALPAGAIPIPEPSLPNVDMEKVVLAAQLDPHRPGEGLTAGAESSVRLVEDALADKGLLARSLVDGHFGTSTQTAWRAWENRMGQSGVYLNTLPGKSELVKLGSGKFDVVRTYDLGDRVTIHNRAGSHTVNQRTMAMFKKAEALSGDMTITQGSYSDGSQSAGTHTGGGVIDISGRNADGSVTYTDAQMNNRVAALRKVGFAAWFRNWSGNRHIHAVAVNDPSLAVAAHDGLCQVYEFRFGGDGLTCDRSDNGADRDLTTWEEYKRTH
jgi:peptidoglycan hydrolase-like protein with peptidoglycan-binding domain